MRLTVLQMKLALVGLAAAAGLQYALFASQMVPPETKRAETAADDSLPPFPWEESAPRLSPNAPIWSIKSFLSEDELVHIRSMATMERFEEVGENSKYENTIAITANAKFQFRLDAADEVTKHDACSIPMNAAHPWPITRDRVARYACTPW